MLTWISFQSRGRHGPPTDTAVGELADRERPYRTASSSPITAAVSERSHRKSSDSRFSASPATVSRAAALSVGPPPAGSGVADQFRVVDSIWRALAASSLVLHYQPIVDLREERIAAMEALLTTENHRRTSGRRTSSQSVTTPTRSAHSDPGSLARPVSQPSGGPAVGVRTCVNMSPWQLAHDGFTSDLGLALTLNGLEPGDLVIEVTEVAPVAPPATRALHRLRDMGVKIWLGDFGTRNADLTALRELPLDTIKLDRDLIRGLRAGSRQQRFTEAIVSMAHTLGLNVVAEGIETAEELEAVTASRADFAQGFLLGRPAPGGHEQQVRHERRGKVPVARMAAIS